MGNWYVPDESAGLFFARTLHDESAGHCGKTTIAGNFSLFTESRKRESPHVSCASLSLPLSPEPCKKTIKGYFFPAEK
jgi:hypothetical protein